jgi:hypothetical protein
MKHLIIAFLALTVSAFAQQKTQDPKMIGSWKGQEKDQQTKGVEKYWIQHRFDDGTYVILFTVIDRRFDSEVENFAEKGKWWTENGKFHEQRNGGEVESYSYHFIDDTHVKFKVLHNTSDFDNPDYQFIDEKIEEDSF